MEVELRIEDYLLGIEVFLSLFDLTLSLKK